MHFIETLIYFLLVVAACLAGLYYTLTGIEPDASLVVVGFIMLLAVWVLLRCLWVATSHTRYLKRIKKEMNDGWGKGKH